MKIKNITPLIILLTVFFFNPQMMFGINEGFDIIISNPPYIKEYVNKSAFNSLRESPYYQGKMDIWYFFSCKGIDLLKKNGILSFIAQNNWITSHGAKKMRNKVLSNTQILQFLDFGDYKIFESAGIQTMIMILKKQENSNYHLDFRRLNFNSKIIFKDIIDVLNKNDNAFIEYLNPSIDKKKFLDKNITFQSEKVNNITKKIKAKSNFNLSASEVINGIHHHHDYVNKSRAKILGNQFKAGQGIFILNKTEKKIFFIFKKRTLSFKT